jgi:hypothetical protein
VPYGLVAPIVAVVLAILHVALTDASRASRGCVVVVVALSLLLPRLLPRWSLLATLLQVGVSVYMLLYWRWQAASRR